MNTRRWIGAVLMALLLPGAHAQTALEERQIETEHFWRNECASCHGQEGQGVDELLSPALAGLPADYILGQIDRIRRGLRNPDEERTPVGDMHREAVELGDEVFQRMAHYVAALPVQRHEPTVLGNPEEGKQPYEELCAQCHGARAEGSLIHQAPPLHGFQDWYLVEQIRRFKLGQRLPETRQLDSLAMHAMATRFDRMQNMRDIAAYIHQLATEGSVESEP